MAMVQMSEGELLNGSAPEDDSHSSGPLEGFERRSSSPSSSEGSKRTTPSCLPSLQYTKDDLMKISDLPSAQSWPNCLDPAHSNATGKWDPDRWFTNLRVLPSDEPRPLKRERAITDEGLSGKRKSSDPKERIKEEKDEIVLSPQRRSFGTGCHVIPQSSLARKGSPTELDNYRELSRRIGSGRLMSTDRRDWDYGYGSNRNDRRFEPDDSDKDLRRYSNRYNRNDRRTRNSGGRERGDDEPEWFSGGPTSQSETIELCGFEDNESEPRKKKANKKSKQTARKNSIKSDDGEKIEANDEAKRDTIEVKIGGDAHAKRIEQKKDTEDKDGSNKKGFDLDDLFKSDWIHGLIPNAPAEQTNADMGMSRFSQFFRKSSPLAQVLESEDNSRRSSFHDELVANVLNCVEPHLCIQPPNSGENYFAPISPALSNCDYALPQTLPANASRDIMEMLNSANNNSLSNGIPMKGSTNLKEMEDNLRKMVLGENKPKEEKSAFDKLLQHMSEANDVQTASISIGPIDKSKVLNEQDLLQDMLGQQEKPHAFQMFEEKQMFKIGMPSQQITEPQNDIFSQLLQQKPPPNHAPPPPQHQTMNHGGFSVDMLSKLLGPAPQVSPSSLSSNMQNNTANMQHQRQHDLLSLLKQQSSGKDMPMHQTLGLPPMGISPRQSPLPSGDGMPINPQGRIPSPLNFGQQPPVLSHAPAPIHPNALAQAIAQNAATANSNTLQTQAQHLQVQSPVVVQRVPSPMELAVHTQTILQNALIKRKLEEQKENFRKRQEAARNPSPVPPPGGKNGRPHSVSPLKGASPTTIAFTPTSVMRKIQLDKSEQKGNILQNGNKTSVGTETRMPEMNARPNAITVSVSAAPIPDTPHSNNLLQTVTSAANQNPLNVVLNPGQIPRTLHGQPPPLRPLANHGRPIVKVGMANQNDMMKMSLMANKNPVVGPHQKMVLPGNAQVPLHPLHAEMENSFDKFPWMAAAAAAQQQQQIAAAQQQQQQIAAAQHQQQIAAAQQQHQIAAVAQQQQQMAVAAQQQQQQMAVAAQQHQIAAQQQQQIAAGAVRPQPPNAIQPQLQMAATFAAMNRPPINPNMLRPVGMPPAANVSMQNPNFPLLRGSVTNSVRAPPPPMSQLGHFNQLSALQQMQRGGAGDGRQLLAQSQRLHPVALQQLLMSSAQHQATPPSAQVQVAPSFHQNRDSKQQQHLVPNQACIGRQSPVNLTKWFGSDVLQQRMPDMPPVPHQKALHVEDIERQQQSAFVRN